MPAESSPCIQFLRFARRSHRFVPLLRGLLRLLIEPDRDGIRKNLESHVHENLMVIPRLREAAANCVTAD